MSATALIVNHGDWTAGRSELSHRALGGADASAIEPILPRDDVPFLAKARHSAFYETQLGYLLRQAEPTGSCCVGRSPSNASSLPRSTPSQLTR